MKNNVRVHFKKWEPVGIMEGYNSKNGNNGRVQFQNGCRYEIVFMVVAGERAKEYHKE